MSRKIISFILFIYIVSFTSCLTNKGVNEIINRKTKWEYKDYTLLVFDTLEILNNFDTLIMFEEYSCSDYSGRCEYHAWIECINGIEKKLLYISFQNNQLKEISYVKEFQEATQILLSAYKKGDINIIKEDKLNKKSPLTNSPDMKFTKIININNRYLYDTFRIRGRHN